MMLRRILFVLVAGPILACGIAGIAAAQSVGLDPNSHMPVLGFRTNQDEAPDTYRRLPYRNLPTEIRIELAADALYDFERGQVRTNAADYLQQTANLIFEHARSPVRIECRSDRGLPAAAQKLAERCALAVSQWLTVQERLTAVKFTPVGASVPPPAPADPRDPFSKAGPSQSHIVIVFAKK
jgi:outer membrane protein OmpA-like peptidoglycan-associated protein